MDREQLKQLALLGKTKRQERNSKLGRRLVVRIRRT